MTFLIIEDKFIGDVIFCTKKKQKHPLKYKSPLIDLVRLYSIFLGYSTDYFFLDNLLYHLLHSFFNNLMIIKFNIFFNLKVTFIQQNLDLLNKKFNYFPDIRFRYYMLNLSQLSLNLWYSIQRFKNIHYFLLFLFLVTCQSPDPYYYYCYFLYINYNDTFI